MLVYLMNVAWQSQFHWAKVKGDEDDFVRTFEARSHFNKFDGWVYL